MSPATSPVIVSTSNHLVGLRQAAEYIGLSRTHLYDLVKRKKIAHVLAGDEPGKNHRIYFRLCDLDAWVESRVRGGKPELRPTPTVCGPLRMPARREFS